MRFLVDSSIWQVIADDLRTAGHDVESVHDWPSDPGDLAILSYAHATDRVLITLDKDFGDLIVRDGRPHAGLLRLVTDSVYDQSRMIFGALQRHSADLDANAIVTVEEDRIRVRPT